MLAGQPELPSNLGKARIGPKRVEGAIGADFDDGAGMVVDRLPEPGESGVFLPECSVDHGEAIGAHFAPFGIGEQPRSNSPSVLLCGTRELFQKLMVRTGLESSSTRGRLFKESVRDSKRVRALFFHPVRSGEPCPLAS
jgi:hypothetical protein